MKKVRLAIMALVAIILIFLHQTAADQGKNSFSLDFFPNLERRNLQKTINLIDKSTYKVKGKLFTGL